MYEEKYNEIMQQFKKNDIYIPQNSVNVQQETKYYVYNDNQSGGDIIRNLCQI